MSSTLKNSLTAPWPQSPPRSANDLESINLGSDYVPNGGYAAGFFILTTAGAVKIDTPAGTTITIPSGLALGVRHDIAFTKLYSTANGTTAVGLMAWVP